MLDMFEWEKLGASDEMKRILGSISNEVKAHTKDPNSSLGLAINAAMQQLSDTNSTVMTEAQLSFVERQTLARICSAIFKEFRS